jgi:imidazole glycerol-phosphate synthase subunit HisF
LPLTKRIIPCLDVDNGRVVKGVHFAKVKDAGDPVALARKYSNDGADELVFLDITASQEGRNTMKNMVRRVARVIDIPFTVGGGIKKLDDARAILLNGADKVSINTAAAKNPELIGELMSIFGKQCVVVAIDAKRNYECDNIDNGKNIFSMGSKGDYTDKGKSTKNKNNIKYNQIPMSSENNSEELYEHGKKFWFEVKIYGGKEGTGIDAIQWAKKIESLGAGEILLTSIDTDGTEYGYDLGLTKAICRAVRIPVIASGGCGEPKHMLDVFKRTDVDAALAASIFHYEKFSVNKVKRYLKDNGIQIRI